MVAMRPGYPRDRPIYSIGYYTPTQGTLYIYPSLIKIIDNSYKYSQNIFFFKGRQVMQRCLQNCISRKYLPTFVEQFTLNENYYLFYASCMILYNAILHLPLVVGFVKPTTILIWQNCKNFTLISFLKILTLSFDTPFLCMNPQYQDTSSIGDSKYWVELLLGP